MGPIPVVLMPPTGQQDLSQQLRTNSSLWLPLNGQVFVANVRGWHLTFSKWTRELWYLRETKQLSSIPGFSQFRLFFSPRDINNEPNVIKPPSASDQALSATWAAQGQVCSLGINKLTMVNNTFFLGPIFLWICWGFSPRPSCALRKWTPNAFSLCPLKGAYCFEKMYSYNPNSHSITLSSIKLKSSFEFRGTSYHLLPMREVWIIYLKSLLWYAYKDSEVGEEFMLWTELRLFPNSICPPPIAS